MRKNIVKTNTTEDDYKVTFSADSWAQMRAYVACCDKEIAWYGHVDRTDNNFYITDVFMFPQEVTGVSVDVDDTEFAVFMSQVEDIDRLRFHGHSHVNMQVNPSSVDTGYQKEMLAEIPDDSYMIYFITNKSGNNYCCIYDKANNIFVDGEDVQIFYEELEYVEKAKEDIKNLLKTIVTPSWANTHKPIITGKVNNEMRKQLQKESLERIEKMHSRWDDDEDYMYYGRTW